MRKRRTQIYWPKLVAMVELHIQFPTSWNCMMMIITITIGAVIGGYVVGVSLAYYKGGSQSLDPL